jgi:hypothetical protein
MFNVISILGVLGLFGSNTASNEQGPQSSTENPDLHRGDTGLSINTPDGYTFPAAVKVKNSLHLFITGSYLYWYAQEDGLDLANTATYVSATNTTVPKQHQGKTLFQRFEFESGFKAGIGINVASDDWVLRADYTRFHSLTKLSKSAHGSSAGPGALSFNNWFYQESDEGQAIAASHFNSKWHLELDWLDATLSRPMYSGRKLTLTPFVGLRTSWIEQTLNIRATNLLNVFPPSTALHSRNKLESWGIGPRAGVDAHFLLSYGFRIQGALGASLLYTQFSKVSHSEDPAAVGESSVAYVMRNYQCARAMAEGNLGLGWGIYAAKRRFHIDMSATYDFNYLWGQNMMRSLNNLQINGTGGSASDLTIQGLTATLTLSF